MKIQKGIILAGGAGSRLYPLTQVANKQLLPIYDKPVIYYPLTTLMLAGIRDILIISTPRDLPVIESTFGSGEKWGLKFTYQVQENPNGLPEAFILGEKFIKGDPVAMILGDNFFHGQGLSAALCETAQDLNGAAIFSYMVEDPWRFGIVTLDKDGKPITVEEKPIKPQSNLAITGLYYFDGSVSERAKTLRPSARGELEIPDLIRTYLIENHLCAISFGRGFVWLDVGTPQSLLEASQYVSIIQARQGTFIASPEEVAWRMNFINDQHFEKLIKTMPSSKYQKYLSALLHA